MVVKNVGKGTGFLDSIELLLMHWTSHLATT